jgi:hypothetical protein
MQMVEMAYSWWCNTFRFLQIVIENAMMLWGAHLLTCFYANFSMTWQECLHYLSSII